MTDIEVPQLFDDARIELRVVFGRRWIGKKVGERPGLDRIVRDEGDYLTFGGEDELDVIVEVELDGR